MHQKSGSESKNMPKASNSKSALLILVSLLTLSASSTTVLAGAVFVGEPMERKGATYTGQSAVEINSQGGRVANAQPYPSDRVVAKDERFDPAPQYGLKPPPPSVSPRAMQGYVESQRYGERQLDVRRGTPKDRVEHVQLRPKDRNSINISNQGASKADAEMQSKGFFQDNINNNKAKRLPPPDPISHKVPSGWLSDGMRGLASKAGYKTLVWALDDSGRKDFRIHAPLTLKGEEHLELLYELAKPYPVRLCLYATDKVAKVIMEGESCMLKGESQ